MIKKILVVFLFLVVVLILGLLISDKVRLFLLVPKIQKVELINGDINYTNARFNARVQLKNSFLFPLLIDSMSCDLKLHEKELGTAGKRKRIKISPLGTYEIILPLEIKVAVMQKEMKKSTGKNEPFECHISVLYDYPLLGKKQLSFILRKVIKIPDPPEANLESLNMTKFGLDNMELIAKIKINNKGDNEMDVTALSYTLKIEKNVDASGKLTKPHHIKSHGITLVDMPVTADLKHVKGILFKKLKGKKKWNYSLHLKVNMKVNKEGFEDLHLNITKEGMFDMREK